MYPANAGFRHGDVFVLSNLTPTRAGEQPIYRARDRVARPALRARSRARFEGEADLFPAGDAYLFTHGRIRRQRFVPRLGWPPWKRVYGFRSDPRALAEIEALAPLGKRVLRVELVDERYYHGDTCLCSFGPRPRVPARLRAGARTRESATRLRERFGDRLIEIGDADAAIYAANSFALERVGRVAAGHARGRLRATSSTRSARAARASSTADVSEFHKKGGGSVKCMIGDLGELPA